MTETAKADIGKALRIRQRVKGRKPSFNRPESWRYVRLKRNWRRPRGLDHKMRRKIRGWPATVSVGYRGPRIARNLHPSGYLEVLVNRVEELKEIDPKIQAVRIAHTVGKRKRTRIITEAKKKKLVILNVREEKKAPEKELPEEDQEKKEAPEKEEPVKEQKGEKPEKPAKKPKKTRKAKESTEKQ